MQKFKATVKTFPKALNGPKLFKHSLRRMVTKNSWQKMGHEAFKDFYECFARYSHNLSSPVDPVVRVGQDPKCGFGVFAKERLPPRVPVKGLVGWNADGFWIKDKSSLAQIPKKKCTAALIKRKGPVVVLDGPIALVNHHTKYNAVLHYHPESPQWSIEPITWIEPDEELLIHYGGFYWEGQEYMLKVQSFSISRMHLWSLANARPAQKPQITVI